MKTNTSIKELEVSRANKRGKTINYVIAVFLIIYCIATITPLYFLLIRSFVPTKDSTELHLWIPKFKGFSLNYRIGNLGTYYNLDISKFKDKMGIRGYINPNMSLEQIADEYYIPKEKIENYLRPFVLYNGWYNIVNNLEVYKALFRTAFVTVLSILVGGFLGILTGSVLARFRRRWHLYIYNLYLLQLIIPPVMIMIPTYTIFHDYLHLTNSLWNLIILNIKGGALSTMIFTTQIAAIPQELKESVELDGGSRLQYLYYIVFPLSKTAFVTFTVITLPLWWNNLLSGLIYLNPEKYTLIPFISSFVGQFTTNFQAMYAGLIFSLLPLIIVYLFFQKLFTRSFLAGAIKG